MNILKDTNSLSQTAISRFFLDTELQCILESGKKIFLKKDEVLFEENSFQETLYIILSGTVEVYKKHKQIAVRGAGDFLT